MSITLAIAIPLLAFIVFLGHRLGKTRGALVAAELNRALVLRDVAGLERLNAQLQEDQAFLSGFLKEFLHVTQGFDTGVTERQIPGLILSVVLRSLKPEGALVLLRRQRAKTDTVQDDRFVVVAAHGDSSLAIGTEVRMGQGEMGFVAKSQRMMSRQDLDAAPASGRLLLKQQNPDGPELDLVAPMVGGEETLGLIAVSGCRRTAESGKAVLRLIAQTGAHAIETATAYRQIKTTADLDGLTKVFNKRHMTNTLAECIFEAQQTLSRLSIFLIDIDNFKNYNDRNGHGAGDRLLQQLALVVRDSVRKDDIFGRFGGEEFLLILPGADLGQAMAVSYKVRAAIAAYPFAFAEGQPLGMLSISGGVAEYPEDAQDSARLLEAADAALYLAKGQGRNRVLAAERHYLGDGLAVMDTPAALLAGNPMTLRPVFPFTDV